MKSFSMSAQKEAPSPSDGEMTSLHSCTSHLVRGAALGAHEGAMVVEVLPLLLPNALGSGQDSLLIPHSSSGFSKAQSPAGPFG